MLPSTGRRNRVISVRTGPKLPERYGFGDGRRRGSDGGTRTAVVVDDLELRPPVAQPASTAASPAPPPISTDRRESIASNMCRLPDARWLSGACIVSATGGVTVV